MAEKKKNPVGRPKKYTKKSLEKAVLEYFDSITYEYETKIINKLGARVKEECYVKPPSKFDLCLYLGIDRGTWLNYCDHERYPEFKEITDYAHLRCEAFLAEELVRREKGVDGIKFNLSNNYGWAAKREVEVGEKTRAALSIDSMSMAEKMAMLKAAMADIDESGYGEGFNDESQDETEEQ